MTQLAEFLFPAPAPRSVGGIVGWWERRRLAYNAFVGSAGLVSVGWVSFLSVAVWADVPDPAVLVGVVIFGVAANVCYSLGAIVEVVLDRLFGGRILPVGPALYRMGLTFSIGLALLPSLVATLAMILTVLARLFGFS